MAQSSTRRWLLWSTRAITIALAARTAFLCAGYLFRFPNFERYRLESATVALIVVGGLLHAATSQNAVEAGGIRGHFRIGWLEWIVWCLASLLLYWPSLHVGLLSDDFVLLDRVHRLAFGFVSADLFRPLPLLAWGAIETIHGGPVGLHALNILAHGTVAWLVSRVASPFLPTRWFAVAAGLLALTFPAVVEAVTWNAGVFDVTSTMFMLLTIVAARAYGANTVLSTRTSLFAYSVAAILCKETAVVIPGLIVLDAWATRRWSRALVQDTLILTFMFVGVGITRLAFASTMVRQPITRYGLQRWLFGTVGGLVVPWHEQVVATQPWIPLTGALVVLGLVTIFLVVRSSSGRTRTAAMCAGWALLGTLPLVTFFFVAKNLEGSRYLYFPSVAYSMLLVMLATSLDGRPLLKAVSVSSIILLAMMGSAGARWHQYYWRQAADERDAVLWVAAADSRLQSCGTVSIAGLPETKNGARLFGNADLAFEPIGLALSDQASSSCAFAWDPTENAFTIIHKATAGVSHDVAPRQ